MDRFLTKRRFKPPHDLNLFCELGHSVFLYLNSYAIYVIGNGEFRKGWVLMTTCDTWNVFHNWWIFSFYYTRQCNQWQKEKEKEKKKEKKQKTQLIHLLTLWELQWIWLCDDNFHHFAFMVYLYNVHHMNIKFIYTHNYIYIIIIFCI